MTAFETKAEVVKKAKCVPLVYLRIARVEKAEIEEQLVVTREAFAASLVTAHETKLEVQLAAK